MIALDTSALYALINRRDAHHERIRRAFLADGGPYLVPVGILAEITYLLEQRLAHALDPFLADLEAGASSPSTPTWTSWPRRARSRSSSWLADASTSKTRAVRRPT